MLPYLKNFRCPVNKKKNSSRGRKNQGHSNDSCKRSCSS
ncbi:hypothetical protein V6Z12_D09G262100 [Gossypium hirsutum]